MTRPVHFVEEVICWQRTACNTRAKLTDENSTEFDEYVTCPKCLRALGYVVPEEPAEQLTEVRGDPLLKDAA